MMSSLRYKAALYAGLFLAYSTLASCAPQSSEDTAMDNAPVTIQLGETLESLQSQYGNRVHIQHQPMGIDFFEIQWPTYDLGEVIFKHNAHSFSIPYTLGVTGSEDKNEPQNEGFQWLSVSAGAGAPTYTPHVEAQKAFYALLKRIQDAGWRHTSSFSTPRIRGKDSYDYMLANYTGSLDADYMPPVDEWRKLKNKFYRFYADGIFLSVKFNCWESEDEPEISGAYLFSFNFETDIDYFKNYVSSEDRAHWRSKVREATEKALSTRKEREAELRAQGIEIDETYQDPPFPEGI